jgi:tRNA(His) 5'-end guanylyltransferase
MTFDELDKKMRVYETSRDVRVLPEVYMVARIDGRSFTRLTKDVHAFEAPFDERFRDYMAETVKHLMTCGFNVVFGYTQSDEISLLFDLHEAAFSRKHRKYNSILAGEASAKFTSLLGAIGVFDCRIIELPNRQLVVDYFRWRNEDAHRNALNAHCYWTLRKEGLSQADATARIAGISTGAKNELLFERGINFNDLPAWQKRGAGIYWNTVPHTGFNPAKQQEETVLRRKLTTDFNLPMKSGYDSFILGLLDAAEEKQLSKTTF